jgi:iron complex transport system substrate-binding protein
MIKKNIPEDGSRKTIYLAGARGVLSTSSGTFFQHHMMEAAGGLDVASELKGGWNEISVEQLMNWNPDVIASVKYCPDGKPEEIYANDKLSNLNAIKEKQVYQMPSNIGPWDMPEPKSILGIMWMSKALYPEAFESIDLEKEANYFHEKFYGVSYDELGGVLDVRGNTQE